MLPNCVMHDGTINEERVACLDLTADETAKVSEAFDDAFQLGSLGLWVTLAAIAAGIAHPHERDAPDVRLDLQTPRSMSRGAVVTLIRREWPMDTAGARRAGPSQARLRAIDRDVPWPS